MPLFRVDVEVTNVITTYVEVPDGPDAQQRAQCAAEDRFAHYHASNACYSAPVNYPLPSGHIIRPRPEQSA
jgi:hypothetical protein